VTVRAGETSTQIDATIQSTFTETLNNPLVFATPNATGCADALKQLLCSNGFPLCPGSTQACNADCTDAITKCSIQKSHVGLFNCTAGNNNCLRKAVVPTIETVSDAIPTFYVAFSLLLVLLLQ